MSLRFRPRLDAPEARDVPASLSFQLPDGSTGSASFSTPAGVDPAESSQMLDITDLTVTRGGEEYVIAPVPSAYYAYGVLVGVVANAFGTNDQIDLGFATAAVTPNGTTDTEYGSIAYDAADTQATFTFPDGTTGSISYPIPWESVDPDLATQSIALTTFNLNIAGQNFAYGSASYTTAPTLQFEYGEFVGLSFALDTSTSGLAYSSISMSGLDVTAVPIGGGQPIFVRAAPKVSMLSFDFSDCAATYTYELTVSVGYVDGTFKTVTFTVNQNTTAGGLRDMVHTALQAEGVVVELSGDNRLIVKGTAANNMKSVSFQGTKHPQGLLKPSILKVKEAGKLATPDANPTWIAREVNP